MWAARRRGTRASRGTSAGVASQRSFNDSSDERRVALSAGTHQIMSLIINTKDVKRYREGIERKGRVCPTAERVRSKEKERTYLTSVRVATQSESSASGDRADTWRSQEPESMHGVMVLGHDGSHAGQPRREQDRDAQQLSDRTRAEGLNAELGSHPDKICDEVPDTTSPDVKINVVGLTSDPSARRA